MKLYLNLYGGLTCLNEDLECFRMNKFTLDLAEGITLMEIHRHLFIKPPGNLVSLVNGRAQMPDYAIYDNCNISIFPPMADRKYNLFDKF